MALSEDLINFDLIETHKENIQSLPGGRSARQLVSVLSPLSSGKAVTLDETKTLNDAIRQEYELELNAIADSDDPLDIYDRYVKWTLNAYPSAQSTPQSQLCPLLERATKAFLTSNDYKNDPRYLKLWLHYIRLFSDAPREIFAFLARHSIGEHLALFYEEFAVWLEGAGRWKQADEVYKLGVEREARPAERLMRKYNQFQQRFEAQPINDCEPSSPALPRVRAALAAKIDPFAPSRGEDIPEHRQAAPATNVNKPKKQKMAIFSDADNETPSQPSAGPKGWDSIGTMRERKKENTIEARPWAGETLKDGKRVGAVSKMEIFKDPNQMKSIPVAKQSNDVINPRTGRAERVFVNVEAVYPPSGEEFSFEELRALCRGWTNRDWGVKPASPLRQTVAYGNEGHTYKSQELEDVENLTENFQQSLELKLSSSQLTEDVSQSTPLKQRRIRVREVKQETQTVKTRLESPTGRKIRRKGPVEPTMTFHSKAAHNDIYDMFNNACKNEEVNDTRSGDDTDYGDDTHSTTGESVATGRVSSSNSEYGDDTQASLQSVGNDNTSVSPWSDFTLSKHIPKVSNKAMKKTRHRRTDSEDVTDSMDPSQNQTQSGFDTQAIAAIVDQDFGELDTIAIAKIAAGPIENDEDEEEDGEDGEIHEQDERQQPQAEFEDLQTPTEFLQTKRFEVSEKAKFVPIPPEDYEPTPIRPYRDPEAVAQNKLPFMTPIVERTESSLAPSTLYQRDYFESKTPSRPALQHDKFQQSPSKIGIDNLLLDSPQKGPVKRRLGLDISEDSKGSPPKKLIAECLISENQKIPFSVAADTTAPAKPDTAEKSIFAVPTRVELVKPKPKTIHKGPIILDLQCNPCDATVRAQILHNVYPSPSTYAGYSESSEAFAHFPQLKSNADKLARQKSKGSPKKSQGDRGLTKLVQPLLKFSGTSRVYAVKRELGKGAFAPVYLVESCEDGGDTNEQPIILDDSLTATKRGSSEAIKVECPPETLKWEFHVLQLLRSRLGVSSRSMQSIIRAHECHLYRDECYLVLDYHSQGTLLDLVNLVRNETTRAGKPAEGLEEPVAMWLSVELLRNMEEIHKVGILHGDLKADNCLVRLEPDVDSLGPYDKFGNDGWSAKGLMLIDFGRGIDTRAFKPDARFIADWAAEETDCAEIREARPWKWEIDLFGAAGVIHSLLFGKYIETVAVAGCALGQKKEWRLRENFKRYWEKEIWSEVFSVLLHGGSRKEDDLKKEVARVRGLMESWLETEGERSGRDLRGGIRRCEKLILGNASGKTKAR